TKWFYKGNTHVELFNIWRQFPAGDSRLDGLVGPAVTLASEAISSELDTLMADKELRLPSGSFSHKAVCDFSLKTYDEHFERKGPYLHQVLTKATKKSAVVVSTNGTNKEWAIAVSTIGSLLLYHRNQQCNLLQQIMGVYLYGAGCPRKVIEVLSKAGICSSYTNIKRSLIALSNDALKRIRFAVQHWPIIILYDNINMPFTKYDQRILNSETFESGTTATAVIGEDLGAFAQCSNQPPTISPLPVKKTETYPLRSMRVDQSSVEGNSTVLQHIIDDLQLEPSHFENGKKIVVAGDQLTTCRVRTLKAQLKGDDSDYGELRWAVPVVQLFHLQMNFSAMILRTHYGAEGIGGSFAFNAAKLKRKRVNLDKHNFHAVDELIRHTLDAMVLHLWEVVLETKDLEALARTRSKAALNKLVTAGAERILDAYLDPAKQDAMDNVLSKNSALLLRDMLHYVELSDSIKSGDLGRIEEVLKWITIMMQAGSTKNYANELLHLHCGLSYAWTPKAKHAIMSSWLVNTSGKPNRWLPADLYQEHNNLLTKVIHAAKGSSSSWEMLAESISLNIETFGHIATVVGEQFKISNNNARHHTDDASEDVSLIITSLREFGIFEHEPTPLRLGQVETAQDLFKRGVNNLQGGRVSLFRERSAKKDVDMADDTAGLGDADAGMDGVIEHDAGNTDLEDAATNASDASSDKGSDTSSGISSEVDDDDMMDIGYDLEYFEDYLNK
ncbi:hypothetical protein BGZ75_000451, partial [Mortierella antarctica]